MPARDPNNASWYVLRYPEQFRSGVSQAAPTAVESAPWMDAEIVHDADRHVTELLPVAPEWDTAPLPGLAVEPGGDVFRVDRQGRLVRRACDGTESRFPCEPDVILAPSGLALDARGLLYVADPGSRRVVVLDTRDGRVVASLVGAEEPVDVAVSQAGEVFVADRAGGRIYRYSAAFGVRGGYVPRNAAGLPMQPRPIAVMIEGGTVVVADARHPRLLRATPDGRPLGDADPVALARSLPPVGDLQSLQGIYQGPRLVFRCEPDPLCPSGDGPARLAAAHLALRVGRLALGRRYPERGVFVSARLDGSLPNTEWHKVVVDADLPPGARLTVETATSEDPTPAELEWHAPHDRLSAPVPFSSTIPDQLVFSPPGRYLWLRVTWLSEGLETPSVRSLKVYYPRNSWLDSLPPHWQRDPDAREFLAHFLALTERVNTRIEALYEAFPRRIDPDAADPELIPWLGCLLDLSFDPSWPVERRRALLQSAVELYRIRGTPAGIRRYIRIYTGVEPTVSEAFLERPAEPAFLGRPGLVLGCTLQLLPSSTRTPEDLLYAGYAHRFTVVTHVPDACELAVAERVIDRIIETNKPAHTAHTLQVVVPGALVGIRDTVGVDLVLGGDGVAPLTMARAGSDGPSPGSTLGLDAVLGNTDAGYLPTSDLSL